MSEKKKDEVVATSKVERREDRTGAKVVMGGAAPAKHDANNQRSVFSRRGPQGELITFGK